MATRREFLQTSALAGIAATGAVAQTPGQVPKRALGKTGLQVSVMGVGGYHIGSAKEESEGIAIIHAALDAGINFFDNAWEYHKGVSEERMGKALEGRRKDVILMTKMCTHGRDKKLGMDMLEESLRRLKTDYLDIWQIHEVVYDNDPDLIFAPGGAIEALVEAKEQGKVRFIGFTGHKDPEIHLKMLAHNFAFDTVQMPLNMFDSNYERSFERMVLPEVNKRGMTALGMKSMGGSGEPIIRGACTVEEALRYAMSLPVGVTISGMESMRTFKQNIAVAKNFRPMETHEMTALRDRTKTLASDGRYELFKTTKKYDGDLGREQHQFPKADELPA